MWCGTMQCSRSSVLFQRNILPPSSRSKNKPWNNQQERGSKQRFNPEDRGSTFALKSWWSPVTLCTVPCITSPFYCFPLLIIFLLPFLLPTLSSLTWPLSPVILALTSPPPILFYLIYFVSMDHLHDIGQVNNSIILHYNRKYS
jgi:hypothetical protein